MQNWASGAGRPLTAVSAVQPPASPVNVKVSLGKISNPKLPQHLKILRVHLCVLNFSMKIKKVKTVQKMID